MFQFYEKQLNGVFNQKSLLYPPLRPPPPPPLLSCPPQDPIRLKKQKKLIGKLFVELLLLVS